jgi:hypothetical protein
MNKRLLFRIVAAVAVVIGLVMAFYFSREFTRTAMNCVGVWATCVLALEVADKVYDKYRFDKLSTTEVLTPLQTEEESEVIERIDIPKLVLIVGESMVKNRKHMNDMMRDLQYAGVIVTYYHYQENKLIFTTDKAQVRFVDVNNPYSYKGMRADEVFGCVTDSEKLYMRTRLDLNKPLYDGDATEYLLELHKVVR